MTTTELLNTILRALEWGNPPNVIYQICDLAERLEQGDKAPLQPTNRTLPEGKLGKVVWAWTQDSLLNLNKGREISTDTAFEQAVYIEIRRWGKRDLLPVISPMKLFTHADNLNVRTPNWSYADTREELIADLIGDLAHRADYQGLRALAKLVEGLR